METAPYLCPKKSGEKKCKWNWTLEEKKLSAKNAFKAKARWFEHGEKSNKYIGDYWEVVMTIKWLSRQGGPL